MKFTSEMILLIVLSVAALWDYCLYVVPNELIVISLIVGFGLNPSIRFVVIPMLITLALMPLRSIRIIGGADIKLLAVMSAFLGIKNFLECTRYLLIAMGVMALVMIMRRGKMISKLREGFSYIKNVASMKKVFYYEQKDSQVMPLSVALFGGYAAYLFLR